MTSNKIVKREGWDADDKKRMNEWEESKDMDSPVKCTNCGETKPKVLFTNPLGKPKGICDQCATAQKNHVLSVRTLLH